ncbi:hypothetical protein N7474_008552 [Penicillium riverlandense]|uniref:uncharacterized protein n=1 Tax=Penicillium riverlandense TaxID=1903569 RepID=UPI002548F05D|nr:uncharacterized protein N7474_008552 [Penicillium riverlandense]KAJ5812251.1 hypothetical protein N7474_008552 [Penicillium riverlandense]
MHHDAQRTGGASTTNNPFEEPQRRMSEYTAQEIATLQARLDKKLGPEYISSRPGAAGTKVHYLAADKCINLANEVFGFNGWSSSIQNDIGYGHIENCKGKAAGFEKAKKEGTTDALKRTLRNFGNVLGNCVYDKDYVSKVTKVKAAPARWDIDDLHRHPDYAPVKKEAAPPVKREPVPQNRPQEDDDLLPPPRPAGTGNRSNAESNAVFEVDGEFGSDLFDEADFVVTNTGNPDEIIIDSDANRRQQPPTPLNGPGAQRGPPGRFDAAVVTPSKPDRWSAAGATARPPPRGPQNAQTPSAILEQSAAQRRPMPGPADAVPSAAPQPRPPQNTNGQPPAKREPGPAINQDMRPPQSTPSTGFYSARAVDLLRDNPGGAPPAAAPQFDPHAESPSIRKTAGVDHTKSLPISKPMLTGGSPSGSSTRDFINPAAEMQRRVGAPGVVPGGGVGSPMNRGQSTSSYRPLTRPNNDSRNSPGPAAAINRGGSVPPPQNMNVNGKRPPLSDVTNANASPGSHPPPSDPPAPGPNDPKRPRVSDPAPQQQQQQQQPPRQ